MSMLAFTQSLTAFFVPVGVAGAVIALACALVAAFAIARGAAGLAGGAIGVWIVGAMLSLAASFADLWLPLLVAVGALGAAVVGGALLRVLIGGLRASRRLDRGQPSGARDAGAHEAGVHATGVREPRTKPTRVAPAQVRASTPVADGIHAAA
ncbi:hypothetical protein Q9R19_09575 [Microbacterium sp. ARD32]|uniref:hypothetical protein n=1 Tax=Microbacterium sp. ARD32 TaxID=2962577 RepID=UPI00288212CA|nr:hypothetical protein [Microbacterium sp. ARD32]MDT0157871.1 hypothetical protein [Microbacterium sp. ARD32]